jgi:enamine deaminase RidA (YjgF/YER057c/UK114 family)
MIASRLISCFVIATLAVALPSADAQRKKKGEEVTQTLEVLPDPPQTIKVETSRLTFHASPLTNKGLLSQQVRDSIKALWRDTKRANIVKLRALVAGTGDMRRVQSIVSEMFSEKRLPLPALSVVQVGLLPMEGAQVILEATAMAKKPANPHGLAFISGQGATAAVNPDAPNMAVAGLASKSVAALRTALESIRLTSAETLRVTCFSSSLDDYSEVRQMLGIAFPRAVLVIVQVQRAPSSAIVECEAVARLKEPAGAPLKLLNPTGLTASPNYSQIALVGAPRVVLTGTQLAFRYQDSDVRLAFERLKGSLEQAGASIRNVAMSSIYPLSQSMATKVRELRFEFYDKSRPPASTMLLFEGLPSLDASFAVDVVAVVPDGGAS